MTYGKLHNTYSITSGSTVVTGASVTSLMYFEPNGSNGTAGECHIRFIDISFGGTEASLSPVKVNMATSQTDGSYPTGASVFAHGESENQAQPSPLDIFVNATTGSESTAVLNFKFWYVTPYMSRLCYEFPENSQGAVYSSSQPIVINVDNPNAEDIPAVINCIMSGGTGV